jgi:hypothetical protein
LRHAFVASKKNHTIVTLVDFVLCLVLCKAYIGNGDLSFCDCCVGSRDIVRRKTRDEKKAETKARIIVVFERSCINSAMVRRIVSSLLFESVGE